MAQRYRKHRRPARQVVPTSLESVPTAVCETTPAAPSRWLHLAVLALLGAVCAALYGRTLGFPFHFDDVMYLQNNPLLRDHRTLAYLTEFRDFIARPGEHFLDPDLAANMAARPVGYATFMLNHLLDGFRPNGWRSVNIVIHLANAFLVWLLTLQLLPRLASRRFIAITAALFFAVHPLAIESVTYIVQRLTSLGAFFFLFTLWLHLRAHQVVSKPWRWTLRAISALSVLCGMLTYESTVTAPVLAVMLDRLMLGTPLRIACRRAALLLLCLPVVPGIVLAISWVQNGGSPSLAHAVNLVNSKDDPLPHLHYLLTQFTVVLDYLRQLFWPTGLNIDPEWPMHRTLLAWPVLRALAVFTLMLGGAAWLWRKFAADARWACVLACTLWFFVTISISSGLVPLPDLKAEHRSYLPSVGVLIGLACLIDAARDRLKGYRWARPVFAALVIFCAGALSLVTVQRNEVWRSTLSLWQDAAAKSPGKFRVWGNLAGAHAVAGHYQEAIECSRKAVELEPRFVNGSLLLAAVLNAQSRSQEALDEMQRLLRVGGRVRTLPDVRYNIGIALLGLQRTDEGERVLQENLQHAPSHWQSHVGLGLHCQSRGETTKALHHLRAALQHSPGNSSLIKFVRDLEVSSSVTSR